MYNFQIVYHVFHVYSPSPTQNIDTLGNVSSCLIVPDHIKRPDYAAGSLSKNSQPKPSIPKEPEIKSTDDILKMRDSCQLAASILKKCRSVVQV